VAAAVIKSREDTEAPQTGWSLGQNVACERPPRPRLIGTGPIFWWRGHPSFGRRGMCSL